MGQIRPENHGPTISTSATTAIVAGTTSGYTEYEVFGPIQMVTDTVFTPATCVMQDNGGNKPEAGVTYPAGFTLYKYFTTIHIASGNIEISANKNKKELGFL